ncbi:MAG: dihydrolipoyl dehydrogenase [bacterium]
MADYDIAVIGGGPGGYVAAIRAAQLGKSVVIFEKDRVGGLCLNWGCIPSKALLKNADVVNLVREAKEWGIGGIDGATYDLGAAIDRSRAVVDKVVGGVEGLLRDNGVTSVAGAASLKDTQTVTCAGNEYRAKSIILATGATTRLLPGVKPDGKVILTSREVLENRTVPKRAVVIGAGPIGVEFAHLWKSYGSDVTVVELLETLVPLEDPDSGRALKRAFEARGIACLVKTRFEGLEVHGESATVRVKGEDGEKALEADAVLIAIGFVPHTEGLNLEGVGVATQRGFITINDQMETNIPGIYAIGDVTGKLMLAHVAMQQGVTAAEHIAGEPTTVLDYIQMPRATFCQPNVGSVGYTEQGAKDAGFKVKTGRFPLTALGKSVAVGHTEGFVKVVADEPTGQILGIHMVGQDINDLLGEATMIALLEATTVEVGFAVHTHPTLAEAVKEAALAVNGEAIHIARRRAGAPQPKEPSHGDH